MPLPRYRDIDGKIFDVSLFCHTCGYAVARDGVTQGWKECPLCARKGVKSKLEGLRTDYGASMKR